MFPIQPCRFPPGEVPNCTNLPQASGQDIYKGKVVFRNGSKVLEEHALGAGKVLGVAQGGPALNGEVNVAKADNVTEFLGMVYDVAGEAIVEVTPALIGTRKGLFKLANAGGYGTQDIVVLRVAGGTETVEITDVKPELNVVIFKFLPGMMQETPATTAT